MKRRTPLILGVVLASSLGIAGCTAVRVSTDEPSAHPVVQPTLGSLRPGFYDPASPPPPEGTLSPSPNSWADAHPPAGYRVILMTIGDDHETNTLVQAVRSWAKDEHVGLTIVKPAIDDQLIPTIYSQADKGADLIISAGNGLVDAMAAATAGLLSQQFLILGAEIAEPTGNVTAADWTGASYRGEGLGTPSKYDPKTFTPERAGRALRAGVAAVVNGVNGIVVWVD